MAKPSSSVESVQAVLHALEGLNERLICSAYGLDEGDVAAVMAETGTPAGWHPLIAGYNTLPKLPARLALSADLTRALTEHLLLAYGSPHAPTTSESGPPTQTLVLSAGELDRLKARTRALYEAGPGASGNEEESDGEEDGNEATSGAFLPIPTETLLEELSQKLQIHPISVYWLLQEIRAEGARCKPEEQRLLEDRLSVLVLRLLGHRWPKQLEAGEPVPAWADRDGIIPLLSGTGETPWPTGCANGCGPRTAAWARSRPRRCWPS